MFYMPACMHMDFHDVFRMHANVESTALSTASENILKFVEKISVAFESSKSIVGEKKIIGL